MRTRVGLVVALAAAVAGAAVPHGQSSTTAPGVTARRLAQNPLITTRSSRTLGDNINGPTVIRVPPWIRQPLGRYYMYFAHHMGAHIRLAYADAIEGPWKIYEPGVLPVQETAFFRPQPDPPENLENFYTHVASPEIYVDHERRQLVMWVHGWWTNGTMWPVGEAAARAWARERGYAQSTQTAISTDGIHFTTRPEITRTSYLRVWPHRGEFYGMARAGLLVRSKTLVGAFETGPNPFRDTAYAGRVRHVAVLPRANMLHVFFSGIGDAPERILTSTIDTSGDWTTWKASAPAELLDPAAPYECATLPNAPSAPGDAKGEVKELHDPAVFEENGRTFLFYSICGEQGIAAAELTIR